MLGARTSPSALSAKREQSKKRRTRTSAFPAKTSVMFSHRNHAGKAYVALGSNLGDRAGNLLLAVRGMMEAALVVTRVSSIYETQPVSEVEQPAFLNMVVEIGNPLPAPEQVMARLLRIECALGRTREVKDG